MRSLILAGFIAAGFLFAPAAHAQSDSLLKANDIRILLNLMDVGSAMQRSLVDEIATGRANNESDLPPQFWDEFEKEALGSVSSFVERLIPTYAQEFSHAEIKSLIEVYRNPAMKKLTATEPVLTAAAGKAGEAWGEEIGMRVALRLDNSETNAATPAANKNEKPAKKK